MDTFASLQQAAETKDPIERVKLLNSLMAEHQAVINEASRCKRQAVSEAKDSGMSTSDVAASLGVTPGRVSQMNNDYAKSPEMEHRKHPSIIMQRALPTEPKTRGSKSLFLTECKKQGVKGDRKMLYVGLEQASDQIAATLNVEVGDEIVVRRKKMIAGVIPMRIATSFFRADLFANTRLTKEGFVKPTLQSALLNLGYSFGHAIETLSVRPPSKFESDELDLEPGEWVVQVLRSSYSTEGTPVHTLETVCAASRHVFPIGQVAEADEF